jgi:hypothetical protein
MNKKMQKVYQTRLVPASWHGKNRA